MYVIMQKDLERRQTMTIAGIASKTREDAQAFTITRTGPCY